MKNLRWTVGFLGLPGFLGIPEIRDGNCKGYLFFLFFLFFLYFFPQKKIKLIYYLAY